MQRCRRISEQAAIFAGRSITSRDLCLRCLDKSLVLAPDRTSSTFAAPIIVSTVPKSIVRTSDNLRTLQVHQYKLPANGYSHSTPRCRTHHPFTSIGGPERRTTSPASPRFAQCRRVIVLIALSSIRSPPTPSPDPAHRGSLAFFARTCSISACRFRFLSSCWWNWDWRRGRSWTNSSSRLWSSSLASLRFSTKPCSSS